MSIVGILGSVLGLGAGIASSALTSASNSKQRKWASAEAQKNRDWQEYMSSTAHQREVEDLRKAGLNPILSATGGSGAAVPSGATAGAPAHDPGAALSKIDILGMMSVASRMRNEKKLTDADVKLKEAEARAADARAKKDSGQFSHESGLQSSALQFEREQRTFDRQLKRTQQQLDHDLQRSLQTNEHLTKKDLQRMDGLIKKDYQQRDFDHTFRSLEKTQFFQQLLQDQRFSHEDSMLLKKHIHEKILQDKDFRFRWSQMTEQHKQELLIHLLKSLSIK